MEEKKESKLWSFLNKISDLVHTIVAVVAIIGLGFAYYAHQRDKSLFVASNKPMIDVTPIAIKPSPKGTHAGTKYSLHFIPTI